MSQEEQDQPKVSRRQFVKGAAASVAAVTAGSVLTSCAPKTLATSATGNTEVAVERSGATINGHSWETPPAPIPASQIKETVNADVVVVGAGLSGLAAAVRAKENGANVIVLEKGKSWSGRGGHFGVADSRLMRDKGIQNDKRKLVRQWIAQCGNRAKEEIVWLFVNESGNAMDWFLDKADAAKLPSGLFDGIYRGESYTEYPGTHMFGMGEIVAHTLYDNAIQLGIPIVFETPGQQLIKDTRGRVTGVVAQMADDYKQYNASKGVILATGDIGGDKEMTQALAPLALTMNGSQYTPAGQNTGDGHKMGLWAGGTFEDPPFPCVLHPQGYAWLSYYILFVNQEGNRYMNEDTWLQAKSLGAMRQPGVEPYAFSIFDSNYPKYVKASLQYGGGLFWDSMGRMVGQEWTPDADKNTIDGYIKDGKLGWQADTLDELAQKIGIPADTFKATVARYNEMCTNKVDIDFGKRPELLNPVDHPPFYALKFGGALLVVTGGLNVDTKLRVLDKDANPIPGLFAVGNVAGNLYGVDYPTIIPGNSHGRALTWGYLAGKNVLEG